MSLPMSIPFVRTPRYQCSRVSTQTYDRFRRAHVAGLAGLMASLLTLPSAASTPTSNTAWHFGTWGIDLSTMDASIKPGDDFYRHENGHYIDTLVIPADQGNVNAYGENELRVRAQLQSLLEKSAAAKGLPAADLTKLRSLYHAFMDVSQVDALQAKPVQPLMAEIDNAKSPAAIAALMGKAHSTLLASVFDLDVDADARRPGARAIELGPGSLALPSDGSGFDDPSVYLDAGHAPLRAAYLTYVASLWRLAGGRGDPTEAAHKVLAFETALAKATPSVIAERDVSAAYHPMSLSELVLAAPGFDWRSFFVSAGLPDPKRIVTSHPDSLTALARVVANTPIDTLKTWMVARSLANASAYLDDRFVKARFDLYGHTINGLQQPRPREEAAMDFVDTAMGQAAGRLCAANYFSASSRARVLQYVGELRAAFAHRIRNVPWMDSATRQEALQKLTKMTFHIGYPEHIPDYGALTVSSSDLIGNVIRSRQFAWQRKVGQMDKPIDREEWTSLPQDVNGSYHQETNSVEFSAAFMQPPFFDPHADDAVNYGAVGGQIGHEMTHALDDRGRRYDANGELRNWWTEADSKRFDALASRLVQQYDVQEVLPGLHLNGRFTLSENIADEGGLALALEAYRTHLGGHPSPMIDGLTGEQRLFMAWAQMFREVRRPEVEKFHAMVDPHSPGKYRVNNVVRNLDDWYRDFDVTPADRLYLAPSDRVRIW